MIVKNNSQEHTDQNKQRRKTISNAGTPMTVAFTYTTKSLQLELLGTAH